VHSASSRAQSSFATDQSPTSQLSTSYGRSASLNKPRKSTISALSRTGSPGRDQDAYFPSTQRCYKLINSHPKSPSTHSQYVRLIQIASVSRAVPRIVNVVNVMCSDEEQWHGKGRRLRVASGATAPGPALEGAPRFRPLSLSSYTRILR